MKSSALVQYVFALVTLVAAAACEELFPKVLDVGFPVLLAGAFYFGMRAPRTLFILFALAAGGAEDALSSLPFLTSASFFLTLAALVRLTQLPYVIAPLAFPAYQLWLCIWTTDLSGSVFSRVFLSIPLGALTIAAVAYLLSAIERKAAIDEEG